MSTMTIPDVRRCNPDALEQLAQRLRREQSRMLEVLAVLLLRRVSRILWLGPAADAATARYGVVSGRVRDIITGLGTSAVCLDQAAAQLSAATMLLLRAGVTAVQEGGFVDEWGHLQMPAPSAGTDPTHLAVRARREGLLRAEVEALVARALVVARSTDDALAQALLAAGHGGSASSTSAATASAAALAAGGVLLPPPAATGPLGAYQNAAWWTSLTPAQKRRVLAEHPDWVGARDGVAATDRHSANLVLLARLQVEARAQLHEIMTRGTPGHYADELRARRRLDELQAVRDVLGRHDGGSRTLLMIDGSGELLEVAMAVGDVDHAEHVATFVGGFTTTVGGDLRRYDETFNRMKGEARLFERGELAVVTWMGYPAPQYSGVLRPSSSVLGGGLARGYSDELAKFTDGIDASREQWVHQTLIAHSYGSVVAGNALLKPHAVSDVAVFGSPGLPFSSATQAGLKAGGLNVLRAKRDPVSAAGPVVHGHEAETVAGSVWLSTEASKDAVNVWRASSGHSEYLEAGTTSEHNVLALAMLRDDLIVPAGDDECNSHFSLSRAQTLVAEGMTGRPLTQWGQRPAPTKAQLRALLVMPVR